MVIDTNFVYKLVNRISTIDEYVERIRYKYTIITLSNSYGNFNYNYTMYVYNGKYIYIYVLYVTNRQHSITPHIVSISIYNHINIYIKDINIVLNIIQLDNIWGKWMVKIVDSKNIKYHNVNSKDYPLHRPKWKHNEYYYAPNIEYNSINYDNRNIFLSFNKTIFLDIRHYNTYTSHIYRQEVQFDDRKYYSISNRYQSSIANILYHGNEIVAAKPGTYVIRLVPNVYCPYADKWLHNIKHKLHSWDNKILDWVKAKVLSSQYNTRWYSYRSVYNSVVYGYVTHNTSKFDYVVAQLGYYSNNLSDIDIYNAYITIVYSKQKISNKKVKSIKADVQLSPELYVKKVNDIIIEGKRLINAIFSIKTKLVIDSFGIDAIINNNTIYNNDSNIQSSIAVDKYNSWAHVSDNDWLSLSLAPYNIICNMIMLNINDVTSIYSNIYHIGKDIGYWYNVTNSGFINKPSLVRLASHEYGEYNISVLVDTYDNDIVNHSMLFTNDMLVSMSSLYDIEYDTIDMDTHIYGYVICNVVAGQTYNVMSNMNWWVISGCNSVVYNNTNLDDIYTNGALDSNVLITDNSKHIYDMSSTINADDDFQYLYRIAYNNNHYINNVFRSLSIPQEFGSVIPTTFIDRDHGRRWRTIVEYIYLIVYDKIIYQLNIYKYNKAKFVYKDHNFNITILKYLKSAKIVDDSYVGHWEDLSVDQVNPLWFSVVEMTIKAKIHVMRNILHWSNVDIRQFLTEQEKWETFIRLEDPNEEPNDMYKRYKYARSINHISNMSYQYKLGDYIRIKIIKCNGDLPVMYRKIIYNRLFIYESILNKYVSIYTGNFNNDNIELAYFNNYYVYTIVVSCMEQQSIVVKRLVSTNVFSTLYLDSLTSLFTVVYGTRHCNMNYEGDVVIIMLYSNNIDSSNFVYYMVHVDNSYRGLDNVQLKQSKALLLTP